MTTILIDDTDAAIARFPDAARLSASPFLPEELWAAPQGSFTHAVIGRPRTARELFRVLSLVERLVIPGGRISILPYTTTDGPENRWEATEAFCGLHPEFERSAGDDGVVELRRKAIAIVFDDGPTFSATLFGKHPATKRVVSLAIFGDCRFGTDFWKSLPQYAVNYVLAHHALFPGYELRIHHDEHLYHSNAGDVLHGLQARGLVRLVYMPTHEGQGGCSKMLWRLAAAWDPDVEHVIARDVDGLPTWTDRCAVEEWIASAGRGETNAHTIHGSPSHCGIMGGLCGYRADALRAMAPTFGAFVEAAGLSDAEWAVHGADQLYLNRIAHRFNVFEHSLFTAFAEDGSTRVYRQPSDWGYDKRSVRFATAVELPLMFMAFHDDSNALIAHLGAAGYPVFKARDFYYEHSPIANAVRGAESDAGFKWSDQ